MLRRFAVSTVRAVAEACRLSVRPSPAGEVCGIDVWRDLSILVPDATMVFDIGANIGQTIESISSRWPAARIVAFEPSPKSIEVLRRRFARSPHVELQQLAMGDAPGQAQFHLAQEHSVNDSLLPIAWDEGTIDRFCAQRQIGCIDVLKVDTQGYDLHVLRGARRMLERRAIRAVLAEVAFIPMYVGQPNLRDLLAFGDEVGYEFLGLYEQTYWRNRPAYANICWRAPL
jgi:FkbM family methyltransferase